MSTPSRAAIERPKSLTDLRRYRIWDCYGVLPVLRSATSSPDSLERAFEKMLRDIDRFGIERIAPLLQVGMSSRRQTTDAEAAMTELRRWLTRWSDRVLGIATL